MDRKWTPGPWVFDKDNVGKSFEWCWQIRTEYGGTPVYVECSSRWAKDDHGNDATAHLIAASPDMYEALEAAFGLVLVHGNSAQIEAVETALRKARGE